MNAPKYHVPKITVQELKLGTLMEDIRQGRIRVPRFQREFVWERSRILKLLDSMFEEYPIGTIFLWNAPPEFNYLLRNIDELGQPSLHMDRSYQIILDGQQRLTSLYVVIHGLQFEGEEYGKIVVDLANGADEDSPFKYRSPDNKRWVSVSDLLSGSYDILLGLPTKEYMERFQEISDTLKSYPFSVVTVNAMEIDDAIEIFERINQQGRRLTRYDLICASVITDDFDLRDRSQLDVIEALEDGFGKIAETSIPQAVALNRKKRADHRTQLDLTTDDIKSVWSDTVEGFRLAVDFMNINLGVARREFLPYDAMLPILVHYFYLAGNHAVLTHLHRQELMYWFWCSAFSERYGESSQTRMTEDAAWISSMIESNLPYACVEIPDELHLVSSSMSSTSAIRNGILCLLTYNKPRHFENGSEFNIGDQQFSQFTRAENHHIFPVTFLRKQGFKAREVHRIPNFCFVPAELNRRIADRPPSQYMKEFRDSYDDLAEFDDVMRSHLIPVDGESGIWTDDYEVFLQQRARMLMNAIWEVCGINEGVEPKRYDPIISEIEIAIRDKIHDVLFAIDQNYWKRRIPGDIWKAAEKRIASHVKKTSVSAEQFKDPRTKLDYCDVTDYSKIITKKDNWQSFSRIFNSKEECKRNLTDFADIRTPIKHHRKVDGVIAHHGRASLLWLGRKLEIDVSELET